MEYFTPVLFFRLYMIAPIITRRTPMQKRKIRNDDEWLGIITKCRTSGMSDKSWCISNGIVPSTFYYAVKRLQKKACTIPEHTPIHIQPAQEVVPIDLYQMNAVSDSNTTGDCSGTAAAIRIKSHSLSLEITNLASRSVIHETISSLLSLC